MDLAHVDAMKRRRSNADHRHRVLIHQHLSAHYILGASELLFPEVGGEYNHRARSRHLVIIDHQQPA